MKKLKINIEIELEDTLEQSGVSDSDFVSWIDGFISKDLEFYSQYGKVKYESKIEKS